MDPIDLSSYAGLAAIGVLTANVLIGLLLATKYNPVRRWPHHRINTVKLHNVTGYVALGVALVHPALLLLPSRVRFGLADLLYPLHAPKQPWVNVAGAAALYCLVFVVVTSYFRWQIGRRWWKRMHMATYALFPLYAVHAILTDPTLRDAAIDPLDGEKVYVELCVLAVVGAIAWRAAWQRRQPPPRLHLPKRARRRVREPV
jgi:predicted ferric reductase